MGHVRLSRVNVCVLFFALTYYGLRLLILAMVGLNITRPASPEFLSSLIIWDAGADTGNVAAYIFTILSSSIFQAYILVCIVQVNSLLYVPIILFMFTMSDFVAIIPYGSIYSFAAFKTIRF